MPPSPRLLNESESMPAVASNIPLLTLLVDNIDGHPEAFKALSNEDRELVRQIVGRYPKHWNEEEGKFEQPPTRGPKGSLHTATEWAEIARAATRRRVATKK